MRMHYVDEGTRDAAPILMLHGEPSWSYLYRSMITVAVAAGRRVIAPDLIGFGKSSKPTRMADYTYDRHCDWVQSLIEGLDLREITLVCQDWGSLIGLRLAAELEDRFAAVVIGNGGLPSGEGGSAGRPGLFNALAFLAWRTFARFWPTLPISRILQTGTKRTLDADELRAYDAPFPDESYKAGARFPAAGADLAARPRPRAEQRGVESVRALGEAFPDGLQRWGSDHPRDGSRTAGAHPRCARPPPYHAPRPPLPAGGLGAGTREACGRGDGVGASVRGGDGGGGGHPRGCLMTLRSSYAPYGSETAGEKNLERRPQRWNRCRGRR